MYSPLLFPQNGERVSIETFPFVLSSCWHFNSISVDLYVFEIVQDIYSQTIKDRCYLSLHLNEALVLAPLFAQL